MESITVKAHNSAITEVLDLIKTELNKYKCSKKEINQAMLVSEEGIVSLIDHAKPEEDIVISIKKRLGKVILEAKAHGTKMDTSSIYTTMAIQKEDEVDEKTEFAIRSILLRQYSDVIKYSHKAGINTLQILLKKDSDFQMKITFGSLILAILIGLGLRLGMPNLGAVLNSYIFSPVARIFVSCMKCIVGPIVFISILNSIIGFDDMKVLGRIGVKVVVLYLFTSIIAISVGFGIFNLFNPGTFGSIQIMGDIAAGDGASISIVDTIVGFFSSNVMSSFLNNDTIQIIIIALFCGVALSKMGERNAAVRDLISALNEMVAIIATIIARTIPVVIFCSISSMMITMQYESMISLLFMAGTVIVGFMVMLVVYCILIFAFARVNPFIMLKKYLGTALTVFTLASSNATIPLNMEFSKKIGVSKKIGSFSIPLGATINMDGACACYIIMALFISKVYGFSYTSVGLAQLFLLVFVVSIGTPGIPGGCVPFLIPMIAISGVPAEGALLIMGIDTIVDMFRTVLNTFGDQTATLVVASGEDMLDKEKYYSKE